MADPLFCYPSAYAVVSGLRSPAPQAGAAASARQWPGAVGRGVLRWRGACWRAPDWVPVRGLLTGCPPAGHDRIMNGTNGQKQLVRPREGRMVAGVCAGIGQFFGIDANIVRIVFADRKSTRLN